jgi:rfaE bifunctional protein nucleotidyltransferase chain/domain
MTESGKIVDLPTLLTRREELRRRGLRLVQCHGCFDIVHPGHIRYLRYARGLGDVLLASITGDRAMAKGAGRPLIPEELRAENLAALDCVDWVYIEPGPTAVELLERVRPDVYVKGREYEFNDDPRFRAEREVVERHGGRVVFSSGDVVFSSSALIAALEQSADPYRQRLRHLHAMPDLEASRLERLMASFRGRRVVVTGETLNDTYVFCDRPEIAGESPIMTLRPVEARRYDGGAAVIALHAAALGARPVLVTALPGDGPEKPDAEAFVARMNARGVEVRSIAAGERIPEKQRLLVGAQKMMKLDLFRPYALDAAQQDRLIGLARDAAGSACDAAIVADFGLGLFSPATLERLCAALRPSARVLAGDVSGRRSSLLSLRGVDLLCPTEGELRDATRAFGESLPAAVVSLLARTSAARAIVTLGSDGLLACEVADGAWQGGATAPESGAFVTRLRSEHIPALAPLAIDPLGCGDALLTAATLALAAGGSLLAAAYLGSAAAAAHVQRLGNSPVSAADLRHTLARVRDTRLTLTPESAIAGLAATG